MVMVKVVIIAIDISRATNATAVDVSNGATPTFDQQMFDFADAAWR